MRDTLVCSNFSHEIVFYWRLDYIWYFFHRARSFLVKSNNRDWHPLQDDAQLIQKHLSYLGFSSVNLRKHSHFLCIESPKWNRILGIRVVKGIINMTFFFLESLTWNELLVGEQNIGVIVIVELVNGREVCVALFIL